MSTVSPLIANEKINSHARVRDNNLFSILLKSNMFWILFLLLGMEIFSNVCKPLKFIHVQGTMLKDHDEVGTRIERILSTKEKNFGIILGDSTADSICIYPDIKNYNVHLTSSNKCQYIKAKTGEFYIERALQHPISLKNLSFGGCLISDQALICKKLLEQSNLPKIALVTVVPRPFIDTTVVESISPVKCYFDHRHHDLDQVKNFNQLFDYILSKMSYIYRSRSDYSTVLSALACSTFDRPANAYSDKNANGLGSRNKVFLSGSERELNAIESANPAAIEFEISKYKSFYKFDPSLFNRQYDHFNKILSSLKEKNICTIVVKLPLDKINLKLIDQEVLNSLNHKIEQNTKNYNATLIDFQHDPSFTSEDYMDSVHLNSAGSIKVWKKLEERLKQNTQLTSSIKDKLH